MRILRIKASEEYASIIFRFGRTLFVDNIDPWLTCIWLA